jgi:hypothetical protein
LLELSKDEPVEERYTPGGGIDPLLIEARRGGVLQEGEGPRWGASAAENLHALTGLPLLVPLDEKIVEYERKVARLEAELSEARRQASRTEAQVREEYERKQREYQDLQRKHPSPAADRGAGIKRPKRKPLNRVIFDVKATIAPDAEGTFEAIKRRHGPTKKLRITHQSVEGQSLWIKMEYTVRGGHPADVRRALDKCLADAGATLVGEPSIEVIERTKLEDD